MHVQAHNSICTVTNEPIAAACRTAQSKRTMVGSYSLQGGTPLPRKVLRSKDALTPSPATIAPPFAYAYSHISCEMRFD